MLETTASDRRSRSVRATGRTAASRAVPRRRVGRLNRGGGAFRPHESAVGNLDARSPFGRVRGSGRPRNIVQSSPRATTFAARRKSSSALRSSSSATCCWLSSKSTHSSTRRVVATSSTVSGLRVDDFARHHLGAWRAAARRSAGSCWRREHGSLLRSRPAAPASTGCRSSSPVRSCRPCVRLTPSLRCRGATSTDPGEQRTRRVDIMASHPGR